MRAVIQKVSSTSVTIDQQIVAQVENALLVFLGIEEADTIEDAEYLCAKIPRMRLFGDDQGKMNLSMKDVGADILVVSQFTLHASTKKGNRPSFIRAARPEQAMVLYESFKDLLEAECERKVFSGEFGAYMEVALVNDGPVTILIDSKNRE